MEPDQQEQIGTDQYVIVKSHKTVAAYSRPVWGSKMCGNYKNVFTYQLMTVGSQSERLDFIRDLIAELWTQRYVIRFEAHGLPMPTDDFNSQEAEYFDLNTLPITWTKWLNLPDPVAHDAPVGDRDALVTEWEVDLTRQHSRKQSKTLHEILDKHWVMLTNMAGKESAASMELLGVKGDVTKLQRIITFTVDGFEDGNGVVCADRVSTLRDFVLYFMHNPTSDSASGFNSHVKKRVVQWYGMPPGTSKVVQNAPELAMVASWNKLLVRTPATRSLSKLLETRRFYARSHRPLDISYNKIAGICRRLFKSSDIWKRGVALMFALGVRPNELFRSFVEFQPVYKTDGDTYIDDPSHWITQVGTSKCSNATRLMTAPSDAGDIEKRIAFKPILFGFTSCDVIEQIAQLRMDANREFMSSVLSAGLSLDEAPTSAITLTVVQRLTRMMYSVFQDEADECTTRGHLFGGLFSRKFYACAALQEFKHAYINRTTPNQFVSEILMHQPGLPTDSVHYVTLSLKFGDDDKEWEMKDEETGDGFVRKRKAVSDDDDSKKRRKRSAMDDSGALYGQGDEMVTLKTMSKEKQKIQVGRFSHKKFHTEDERQEYFCVVKQFLTDNNIRPSIANLTAIGVSPQFQSARKKHLKNAKTELNKLAEEMNEAKQDVDTLESEVKQYGDDGDETETEESECMTPVIYTVDLVKDDEDDTEMDDLPEPPKLSRQNAYCLETIKE